MCSLVPIIAAAKTAATMIMNMAVGGMLDGAGAPVVSSSSNVVSGPESGVSPSSMPLMGAGSLPVCDVPWFPVVESFPVVPPVVSVPDVLPPVVPVPPVVPPVVPLVVPPVLLPVLPVLLPVCGGGVPPDVADLIVNVPLMVPEKLPLNAMA